MWVKVMRISVTRAVVIMLCAAFVLAAGALQSGAFISDLLFPSNSFDVTNTHHLDAKDLGNQHFFSTAMGQIPGVDKTTAQPASIITASDNGGVHNSLKLPSMGTSWMGNVIAPAIDSPNSQNVAMTSYQKILNRFPSEGNIFENTHLVT
jgi:hypothetical protein